MNLSNVLSMGVSEKALAADRQVSSQGAAPSEVMAARHRFSSLIVGTETLNQPALLVMPIGTVNNRPREMMLGGDYLRTHRGLAVLRGIYDLRGTIDAWGELNSSWYRHGIGYESS